MASSAFLHRLACLPEQAEGFSGLRCKLQVSDEYTITGFYDGCRSPVGTAGSSASIRVNDATTLSLDPEVLGTILGIDMGELQVPRSVSVELVRNSVVVEPGHEQDIYAKQEGFDVCYFEHRFQEYVRRRGEQLFLLQGCYKEAVSAAMAHTLIQEYVCGDKFNWAEHRTRHIHDAISRAFSNNRYGRGPGSSRLSLNVKSILSSYISVALSFLRDVQGPTGRTCDGSSKVKAERVTESDPGSGYYCWPGPAVPHAAVHDCDTTGRSSNLKLEEPQADQLYSSQNFLDSSPVATTLNLGLGKNFNLLKTNNAGRSNVDIKLEAPGSTSGDQESTQKNVQVPRLQDYVSDSEEHVDWEEDDLETAANVNTLEHRHSLQRCALRGGPCEAELELDQLFLKRLGCLTGPAGRQSMRGGQFQDTECALKVSSEYIICGFHDGRSSGDSPCSSSSSILVRCTGHHTASHGGHRPGGGAHVQVQALSLEPEMIGRILGIEFKGSPVQTPRQAHHITLAQMSKVVMPDNRARVFYTPKNGFCCTSFQPTFRKHVEQRRSELRLAMGGCDLSRIAVATGYCLMQEVRHNARFNWAKHRADYAVRALGKAVNRTGSLSAGAKALLSDYIAAALPHLQGLEYVRAAAGSPAPEQQLPRRSSRIRNMSSKLKSKRKRTGGPWPLAYACSAGCCPEEQSISTKRKKTASIKHFSTSYSSAHAVADTTELEVQVSGKATENAYDVAAAAADPDPAAGGVQHYRYAWNDGPHDGLDKSPPVKSTWTRAEDGDNSHALLARLKGGVNLFVKMTSIAKMGRAILRQLGKRVTFGSQAAA